MMLDLNFNLAKDALWVMKPIGEEYIHVIKVHTCVMDINFQCDFAYLEVKI